uniref:heme oxygenase-like n=1 Tax=Ciona intestinalis TaxID=7719 RepID=UPI000180BEBE|nr:heme oxygenase-like [Ciona intestinalis]|eukprot:XP_009857539.1 heme oxygenase-like [Ciona intestinalis]
MSQQSFCDELREKSSKAHAKSDKLMNVKLAVALTDTSLYSQVLGDFYAVFNAIENGIIENEENEYIKQLWHPAFGRVSFFERDLEFYLGSQWKRLLTPSDAAMEYVSHIEDITENEPILLVAYVHTMYLAIFSGGFILKKIIKTTLNLNESEGVNIFDTAEGESRLKLKQLIKTRINAMDFDRSTKDLIIQEKLDIFAKNNQIVSNLKPKISSFKRLLLLVCLVLVVLCVLGYALLKMFRFVWDR